MKILDKEIEFDFREAENIDRVIELDKKYKEEFNKVTTLTEKSKVYRKFFDDLIGEGTSQKLFGNKNNLFEMIDAYNDLVEESERINTEINKRSNNMKKKYERYK